MSKFFCRGDDEILCTMTLQEVGEELGMSVGRILDAVGFALTDEGPELIAKHWEALKSAREQLAAGPGAA